MPDESPPSISINGISHPILCGLCRQPIAFRSAPDEGSSEAGCVACDNFAETEEVARIAVEYAKAEGQLAVNRMAKDTSKKADFMTFSGPTSHNKNYRFVVDLQL